MIASFAVSECQRALDGDPHVLCRAMAQGMRLYGSASIGALRAAELHSFGIVVIGRIFEAYRDSVLVDDDEVAVLHGPGELRYPALTETMVNIRATLDKAVEEGVLDCALAARLTEIGETLFYKERNWSAILRRASDYHPAPLALDNIATWLGAGTIDQKRIDALAMTEAIQAYLATGVTRMTVSYQFQDTGYHKAATRQVS